MVGRDIGTVVMPDAELKIFLVASLAERARRRCAQLSLAGQPADFDTVLAEIERRDELDSERAVSPLKPAGDAVRVETDGQSIDAVVRTIERLAMHRLACRGAAEHTG
jgi:cytidylate kinase